MFPNGCFNGPYLVLKTGINVFMCGCIAGHEINFFSDSHLAPKFTKLVANSKKVGRHFARQTQPFFYTVIVLEIKLGKRSLTCYRVDTRMDVMQR